MKSQKQKDIELILAMAGHLILATLFVDIIRNTENIYLIWALKITVCVQLFLVAMLVILDVLSVLGKWKLKKTEKEVQELQEKIDNLKLGIECKVTRIEADDIKMEPIDYSRLNLVKMKKDKVELPKEIKPNPAEVAQQAKKAREYVGFSTKDMADIMKVDEKDIKEFEELGEEKDGTV